MTKSRPNPPSKRIPPAGTYGFGTGLTRRTRWQYDLLMPAVAAKDDPELGAEIGKLLSLSHPSNFELLSGLERWARDILNRHALPDRTGYVMLEDDGGWRWVEPENLISECEAEGTGTLMSALSLAQREEDTPPWFAATVLELLADIRLAIDDGKTASVAQIGLQLGAVVERFWWKFNHEAAAEDGYRMRKGRTKGAAAGSAAYQRGASERHNLVIVAARQVWALNHSLIGKYEATAKILNNNPAKYFGGAKNAPLSVASMKRIVRQAYKAGDLTRDYLDQTLTDLS